MVGKFSTDMCEKILELRKQFDNPEVLIITKYNIKITRTTAQQQQ